MMNDPHKPELKQIWDLREADFQRHPVWIGVHNTDFGKAWYDMADEATYRPWTEPLPASAERGFVLVRAEFQTRDGSRYAGFVRAASQNWDAARPPRRTANGEILLSAGRSFSTKHGGSPLAILGIQQPRMFVGDGQFSFWGGRRGISPERRSNLYAAVGKCAEDVFPLSFEADAKLCSGVLKGEVHGFYQADATIVVIR